MSQKTQLTTLTREMNPALSEKFSSYWTWRGLCYSYATLKNGSPALNDIKRLRYLRNQILWNYFKNFFLFPIFFIKFLIPSYMKGDVTVWTNLRTIFREQEFHPLRMAVLSQLCFVFIFVQLGIAIVHWYSGPTKAATYTWIQTSWFGNASTVATASHSSDQTGWNKFYSTSSIDVNTSVTGEVSLSPSLNSTSQTSDTDFNTWTKDSSLATSSTGSSGRIVLLKPDGASCTQANQCRSGLCTASLCVPPPCAYATSLLYSGVTYPLKELGTQCWFAANLNVGTKLASGTTLPSNNSLIEKWCYSNSEANCTTYGGLYTWAEANQLDPSCNSTSCTPSSPSQGICPSGWHIPTDTEFKTLESYLGMCAGAGTGCVDAVGYRGTTQGTQLKSGGSSGFNMPFGGLLTTGGSFSSLGTLGYLWFALEDTASNAWYRFLYSAEARVNRGNNSKILGLSVRCLKN